LGQAPDCPRLQTAYGWPVHSSATLRSNPGTIGAKTMCVPNCPEAPIFTVVTTPPLLQAEVLNRVAPTSSDPVDRTSRPDFTASFALQGLPRPT